MLVSTYWWARSLKVGLITNLVQAPATNLTNINFFFICIPYTSLHNFKALQIFSDKTKTFIKNVTLGHGCLESCHILHICFQCFHILFHWVHPPISNKSTQIYFVDKMIQWMCHNVEK
jgi:hypothetical protein